MNWTNANSSNIRCYAYDPAAQALWVVFKNGGVYRYEAVPAAAFKAFDEAPSKGHHLATAIKGKYAFSRPPTPADLPPDPAAAPAPTA